MVTILTGEMDAGKTSFMEAWYAKERRGTGFFSRKVFAERKFLGYDLILLPGMKAIPFIRLSSLVTDDDPELGLVIRRNRFAFSRMAFLEARLWVEANLCPDEPVWIDEVGRLELGGEGFDVLLHSLFSTHPDIRAVFRHHLLKELIDHYSIDEKNIICLAPPVKG